MKKLEIMQQPTTPGVGCIAAAVWLLTEGAEVLLECNSMVLSLHIA